MRLILNENEITNTKSFKKLDQCYKNIILRPTNKKVIAQGLEIHRNSGLIPGNISGNNLKILKDLIEKN
ncbi:hypothetical protein CLU81_0486 [Flavobacterium sp. 9]|nr:hypothetical protein CLU81_0486 [Flavobacterium sp. 9]